MEGSSNSQAVGAEILDDDIIELSQDEEENVGRVIVAPEQDTLGHSRENILRWRMQTLLARNTFGIPMLKLSMMYHEYYGTDMNVADLGHTELFQYVSSNPDIFTIQEPDETTAIIFPDSPYGIILHDARLGLKFKSTGSFDIQGPRNYRDPAEVIAEAYMDRDEGFPPGVVLPGQTFPEHVLPMTVHRIDRFQGVFQAVIVGVASPSQISIHIKSPGQINIESLSEQVNDYFQKDKLPMTAYSVPDQFIIRDFPCLIHLPKTKSWERCRIADSRRLGKRVYVEAVDFGEFKMSKTSNMYLMPSQFLSTPRQSAIVSMYGLEPPNGKDSWSALAGNRMRAFSHQGYWLDILLAEVPKKSSSQWLAPIPRSSSDQDGTANIYTREVASTKNHFEVNPTSDEQPDLDLQKVPLVVYGYRCGVQYHAVICDRNHSQVDIFPDEILQVAGFARYNEVVLRNLNRAKKILTEAVKDIPRPENPLKMTLEPLKIKKMRKRAS